MANNVLNIKFVPCEQNIETAPLYQYDYGQRISFSGVTLPDLYEVHFSNSKSGDSVTVIGDSTGVDIPDALLQTGAKIYGWIYLHTGEDDGETEYRFIIPVIGRAKPTHETPTPVQQSEIEQIIALLEAENERARTEADEAEEFANISEEWADKAEQSAVRAGYMEMHIDSSGHLIYERTDSVSTDFRVNRSNGHLILEAV